jgi:NAD(P)-dependent dehydrogenase (short-subunit alcohol dehydrogenase family)
MNQDLQNESHQTRKRVLVTGATRGIGNAICVRLAKVGYDLIRWSRSGHFDESFDINPSSVLDQIVDVTDSKAVSLAFSEIADRGLELAGLVINAGVGRWRSLRDIEDEEWRKTIETNLYGAFHVLRGALDILAWEQNPVIVGILSDSALFPFADRSAYASSKAAIKALLETARREERSRGLRFSLVYPSRVDTYFAGSLEHGYPGARPSGLDSQSIADVVSYIFGLPPNVEIREVHLSAMSDVFGPYPERKNND